MANYKYTEEHLNFMEKEFHKGTIYREIARQGNERFGTNWNESKVTYALRRLGLSRGKRPAWTNKEIDMLKQGKRENLSYKEISKAIKKECNQYRSVGAIEKKAIEIGVSTPEIPYTEEEEKILQEYGKTHTDQEIVEIIYKETGHKRTPNAIKRARLKRRIIKHDNGRFEKGDVPSNKQPIGHIRKDGRGYWIIKTSEGEMELLHRRIYRMKHKVKLSPEDNIIFLDGDSDNLHISNLKRISRSEHSGLLGNKYRFDNPEMTKAGLNIIRLENKVNELKEEQ